MSKLKQISIYPIKSCSGINLEQAKVEDRGFPFDRRWMLIDKDGQFISQRKDPSLSLLKISVRDNQLHASYGDTAPLVIDVDQVGLDLLEANIWKDTVISRRVSSMADEWFSNCLEKPARLVHMDSKISRPLLNDQLPVDRSFEVSFADGYPYLLTNQASLDDLNTRLDVPIEMDRFRANLIVDGFDAFAEDHWKKIRIGKVEFMVVKPCARCQVTTIDQKTGQSSKEPLKTLASFRKQNGKVMFGMNLVAINTGQVEVGSPVRVLEKV